MLGLSRSKISDLIEAGQVMMVLEAMKMENNVTAPAAGRVESVEVGQGGQVRRGQTLVVLGASLDLSVTYVISLSSLLAATTMNGNPANIPAAVAITLRGHSPLAATPASRSSAAAPSVSRLMPYLESV